MPRPNEVASRSVGEVELTGGARDCRRADAADAAFTGIWRQPRLRRRKRRQRDNRRRREKSWFHASELRVIEDRLHGDAGRGLDANVITRRSGR